MVGGRDYDQQPFNLATQGQRQPGSSIKPFTLAAALDRTGSPRARCGRRASASSTVPGPAGARSSS